MSQSWCQSSRPHTGLRRAPFSRSGEDLAGTETRAGYKIPRLAQYSRWHRPFLERRRIYSTQIRMRLPAAARIDSHEGPRS
jgi:hypothetical protein